jgi:hypothetical protein
MVIRFPPLWWSSGGPKFEFGSGGIFNAQRTHQEQKKKKKRFVKIKNKKVKGVRPDPGQRTHHSIHKTKKQRATSKTSL